MPLKALSYELLMMVRCLLFTCDYYSQARPWDTGTITERKSCAPARRKPSKAAATDETWMENQDDEEG